jgi:hypothetical protein
MSIENKPRYQSSKTDRQRRKNPINRPREQYEQQTKARLDSLQEEIDRNRRELIALIDREIAEGKKEGRVVGTLGGRDIVQLLIKAPDSMRSYHFVRLSQDTIIVLLSIVREQPGEEKAFVLKGYFLNTTTAAKDKQSILVGRYNSAQRKVINFKDVDPEKEKDAYQSYDKSTPGFKEMKADIEKSERSEDGTTR